MHQFTKYWDNYYQVNKAPNFPSNFGKYCKKKFCNKKTNILEIGCGNGRDTIFFSKYFKKITCIDRSKNAIKIINKSKKENDIKNINTIIGDEKKIENLLKKNKFDLIYMRWFLHSIPISKENYLFGVLSKLISKKSVIAIEARTSHDNIKKNKKTKKISNLEYVSDGNHYRRLMDKNVFFEKIKDFGFEVIYKKESKNFSNLQVANSNKNPSLIRLFLKKK